MALLFAMLYWGIPNCHVSRWHAKIGGVFAALGFVALRRLFGLYVADFTFYAMMYGTFFRNTDFFGLAIFVLGHHPHRRACVG